MKMAAKSGAEEEDDYMGNLSSFLPPEPPSSKKNLAAKPAQPPQTSRSKLPKNLSWQDRRRLERERKQEEEDEMTKAGLEASIPPSNVGFKMLQKMGFSPAAAKVEPVGLEIRRSRAGIGAENPRNVRRRKERESEDRKKAMEEEIEQDFGTRQRSQWRNRKVVGDYRKAEAALAQLENREVVEPENKEEDGEAAEKGEAEEEEEEITEEDLHNLLLKLRDEYHYCLYCGFQYESAGLLLQNCPGLDDDDH